ncbi:unnamed protein product [marine sediment metagenome]|uniref:SAP domain-containing protein n=1 Tax=marine sediment metagenome TaxID=412755 RepID=X1KV23_9ZZZZ
MTEISRKKLTVEQLGALWNTMTPIEREHLGVEAKLSIESRGERWMGLWSEEKRAIRRAYEKELVPKVGMENLFWLTIPELQAECRKRGLLDSGSKAELVQRLKGFVKPPREMQEMLIFLTTAISKESTESKLRQRFGDVAFDEAYSQGFITRTPQPSPSKRVVSITLKGREWITL